MTTIKNKSKGKWYWIEFLVIAVFLINVFLTLYISISQYGWANSITWITNLAPDGIATGIWSVLLNMLFVPFTVTSLVICFIANKKQHKENPLFKTKYWNIIVILQATTWMMIYF